jgi:hypothetical protein
VAPNDLWCADFKGEFKLGNGRYCFPLTVSDHASRFLLLCEALDSTREDPANIDLLDAELQVAQTECDDIDQAIAQIGAADPEAKADFLEITERRQGSLITRPAFMARRWWWRIGGFPQARPALAAVR